MIKKPNHVRAFSIHVRRCKDFLAFQSGRRRAEDDIFEVDVLN